MIQAPKRTKLYTHIFPDVTLVFEPNASGHVVCDVEDKSAIDRLLSAAGAFVPYGPQIESELSPVLAAQVAILPPEGTEALAILPPATDESPYLLKDEAGEVVLDLRPLTDDELHAFAQANDIKVHPKAKGDTIRDKIVEFLSTAE
jgi:hypothetical protein